MNFFWTSELFFISVCVYNSIVDSTEMTPTLQLTSTKNLSMMTKKWTLGPLRFWVRSGSPSLCARQTIEGKYTDGGDFFFHVSAQQASDKARGNHSNYEYSSLKNITKAFKQTTSYDYVLGSIYIAGTLTEIIT